MTALASFALAGCLAVGSGSDHVLFRDLAAAFSPTGMVPPETPVALAPLPGAQRVFHLPELRRLALRLHLDTEPQSEVCVERPVEPPDPARLLAAMQKELAAAKIDLLDYSRQPLPEGVVEFPVAGLRPGVDGNALWTGSVRYAGNRLFHTWARVRVSVTMQRVFAVKDLPPGQPIDPAQLRVEALEAFPAAAPFAGSLQAVAGQWPKLPIRAGSAIRTDQLQSPRDVMQGQVVTVDVRDGRAHLKMEVRAEAGGARGETIPVLNLASHRRFSARVEGPGRVSVDSSLLKVNP